MEQALNKGGTGRWGALILCALMLTACAETQFLAATAKRVSRVAEPTGPAGSQGVYKVGKPLPDRRHLVLPGGRLPVFRNRHRILVRPAVPRS